MLTDVKGRILAKRVVIFDNPWSQGWGLMFRKAAPDTAYCFTFDKAVKSSFHMYFVFWPIDLFLLDKSGTIIEEKRNFAPFSYYQPKKAFHAAIETAPGLLPLGIKHVKWALSGKEKLRILAPQGKVPFLGGLRN
jgi:uncharacterized membrane protein (UPF0127 family)